jgi:hypothetical protein
MSDESTLDQQPDWRLEVVAEGANTGRLDELVAGLAGNTDDVVITHDGNRVFAYAPNHASLVLVRADVESALQEDGITATVRSSHWDDDLDDWRQIDPPPTAEQDAAAARDSEAIETRTIVASAGRLVRKELEDGMTASAKDLDLELTIVEHRHLLSTQVAFTVTGPRRKLDEFRDEILASGWASIRLDNQLLISPL